MKIETLLQYAQNDKDFANSIAQIDNKIIEFFPNDNVLTFTPRGYSKTSTITGKTRQADIARLSTYFDQGEHYSFPKAGISTVLTIINDPKNKFDPNSLEIICKVTTQFTTAGLEFSLGYVPMEISHIVNKNLGLMKNIWLQKIGKAYGKYHATSVGIRFTSDFKPAAVVSAAQIIKPTEKKEKKVVNQPRFANIIVD